MEIFGFELISVFDAFMAIPFVLILTVVGIPIVGTILVVTVVGVIELIAAIWNACRALLLGMYHLVCYGIEFLMSYILYTGTVIAWAIISYIYFVT